MHGNLNYESLYLHSILQPYILSHTSVNFKEFPDTKKNYSIWNQPWTSTNAQHKFNVISICIEVN